VKSRFFPACLGARDRARCGTRVPPRGAFCVRQKRERFAGLNSALRCAKALLCAHSVGVYTRNVISMQIEEMHEKCNQDWQRFEGCPGLPALPDETDKLCVSIAALGHDTGHGPKSHLFETVANDCFSNNAGEEPWNHEAMSVKMVGLMLQEDKAMSTASEHSELQDLSDRDEKFIYECILGKDLIALPGAPKKKHSAIGWQGREQGKFYLYDIVSNGIHIFTCTHIYISIYISICIHVYVYIYT